jgi:hypothetical protein
VPTTRSAFPTLLIVSDCVSLVVPTCRSAKVIAVGVIESAGIVPVPLTGTSVIPLDGALLVTRTDAFLTPNAVGLKAT